MARMTSGIKVRFLLEFFQHAQTGPFERPVICSRLETGGRCQWPEFWSAALYRRFFSLAWLKPAVAILQMKHRSAAGAANHATVVNFIDSYGRDVGDAHCRLCFASIEHPKYAVVAMIRSLGTRANLIEDD